MQITETFKPTDTADWRRWLEQNHNHKAEIWLVFDKSKPNLSYVDSVYEAICFGWIDGIAKKLTDTETAQRFTPRRPKSNWTELNKQRARYLIHIGKMAPAGTQTLPDLTKAFTIPEHILNELQRDPICWQNFQNQPDLYKRVRISYIDEFAPGTDEYAKRLANFITKTHNGELFGNWNDGGYCSFGNEEY